MKYVVIESFTDLQDNNCKYAIGDSYPRSGKQVSESRINELLTNKNRRERPMIKMVEEESIEEDTEKVPSVPKKDTKKLKTNVTPSKTTKTKRGAKKAQGEI